MLSSSSLRISAGRRARRTRRTASRRSHERLGELLGRDVTFVESHDPERREGRRRPARERPVRCGRDVEGRRRARGVRRRGWPTGSTAYVDDAFGAVHRTHASVYDVAKLLPHAAGDLVLREVEVLAAAHRAAAPAVRRRARWLEGLRQAGRDRAPAADRRPAAGRRRDVLHLPRRPGPSGRALAARARPDRDLPRFLETGKVALPVDVVVAAEVSADAETAVVVGRGDPDGHDGPRHRAGERRAVPRATCRERTRCSGTARWGCSSWHRSPRARGVSRRRSPSCRRADRGRWRRLRGRGPRRSASTRRDSVTSQPAAARAWSTSKARSCPGSPCWWSGGGGCNGASRTPLMAGNWKMNLNHLEAIALVQKLAFSLTDKDFDAVEVAVLPPFTDIRSVQTMVDGDHLRIKYGAQDLSPHDSGAYTGDISGVDARQAGLHLRHGRALRAPRAPPRGRRDRQRQGRRPPCVTSSRRSCAWGSRSRCGASGDAVAPLHCAAARRARRRDAQRRRSRSSSRTSRSGRSAPARWRRRRTPRRSAPRCGRRSVERLQPDRRRTRRACCTAARSRRTTPPSSWRSPTLTALLSAEPA